MIDTGQLLQNRYRIDKKIGQGGMGAVYVATDERFGSRVAIKETLFMDDNYRKAIEREARLLNSLKHSALPRVSDHFLDDNGQYLVMEYIPGEDLAHMIENGGTPFRVDDVLKWADQLMDALDFLHNQAIPVIHRDIKPQNLKITSGGQIILLDFGLAKGNPTDAGHQTAAKSIFGYSRNYASLEQIQGTGTDPRSDLYSLAATLYHLLTGVPPEDALSRAMNVLSQKPDPLIPANQIRSEIPAGVAWILENAMDLNAERRPESADSMRKMLLNHIEFADRAIRRDVRPEVINFHDAETRLLGHPTRAEGGKLTDVKTKILPLISSSNRTVARSGDVKIFSSGDRSLPRPTRRFVMAAFAGIVLTGLGVAGVFFYDPSILVQDAQVNFDDVAPIAVAESNPPVVEFPSPDAAVAASGTEPSPQNQRISNSDLKKPVPVTTARTDEQKKASAGQNEVRIENGFVYVGNMKVSEVNIETPDTFIDENGIRRKTPVVGTVPIPPITPGMTDEEKRKLRLLIRQQRLNQLKLHPKPTP